MQDNLSLLEAVQQHQQGHVTQARQAYIAYLNKEPQNFDARHLLGVTYLQSGDYPVALENIQAALQINPNNAAAYSNLGRVLHETQRYEEALASYDKAIQLKPDFAEAHYNKGNTLRELKRADEAIAAYELAIQHKSHYAEAYQNLGVIAHEQRHLEQAIALYGKTIAIKPTHAEAHSNRGVALKALHRIDEALRSFDLSISINPQYAQAYWNKAITLLLDGQYEKGWQLFEWGWAAKQRGAQRHTDHPLWTGLQPLKNKTILLHAEQGYGDAIQFCRYAKSVSALGAKVVLEVPSPLVELCQQLEGVHAVIATGQPIADIDFQCPLMTLPMAFKTTLATIPSEAAYLRADTTTATHWKNKLSAFTHKKVGLVWNGGFRPHQPELWLLNSERNITLEGMAQVLQHADIDFFSLQKGDPAESEIRGREKELWPQGNFHNFTAELKTFSDTAALIEQLDLVISVDTSTAHLAAAMGKPVWLLNRADGCWRWLIDVDDSPWYPSVHLYRQGQDRNWAPVLKQVALDLAAFAVDKNTALENL